MNTHNDSGGFIQGRVRFMLSVSESSPPETGNRIAGRTQGDSYSSRRLKRSPMNPTTSA